MGFFGRLFGGGGRKPPPWARGAFRSASTWTTSSPLRSTDRSTIARGGTRQLLRFNRGNCQLRRRHYDEAAADFRACVAPQFVVSLEQMLGGH